MSMQSRSVARAIAILLAGTVGLAGQAGAQAACNGVSSAVCVSQVGDNNQANSQVDGQRNGSGVIGAETVTNMRSLGSNAAAPALSMPAVSSGTISQDGRDNQADVDIRGDDNQFHVSQQGDRNKAVQIVQGSRNTVAAEQGEGPLDSDNVSVQVQLGDDNVQRVRQNGSGNVAVQAQVGTAEAALLAFSAGASGTLLTSDMLGAIDGGAGNNRILLEQNGDDNEAYLAQVGFDNDIALRQNGASDIAITQFGVGHSIAIDQPAGMRGVQIVQY